MSFVDTLITFVRENPELYDSKSKGYTDATQRTAKWKLVANILGKDAETCKKRWRNLRDRYVRENKTNFVHSQRWEFRDKLHFLRDSIKAEGRSSTKRLHQVADSPSSALEDYNDSEKDEEHDDPLEVHKSVHKITFRLSDNEETSVCTYSPKKPRIPDTDETSLVEGFLEKLDEAISIRFKQNEDDNDVMMRALALKMKPLPMNVKISLQEQFLQEINRHLLLHENYTEFSL